MELTAFSFLLFALFSGLRIVSYIPQIRRVATDMNGASAISYATWGMWTGANLATALYAAVNLGDAYLATVSALYACCCVIVIVLTVLKRRRLRGRLERRCSNTRPNPMERKATHELMPPIPQRNANEVVGFVIADARAGRIYWDEGTAFEHVRMLALRKFVLIPVACLLRKGAEGMSLCAMTRPGHRRRQGRLPPDEMSG